MSETRTVPGLSAKLRYPPRPYQAPTSGTVEERLADISREINNKADRTGIPNFTAIRLTGENGLPYHIYVDATGALRCVPATQ
jgi:hypothetical protein